MDEEAVPDFLKVAGLTILQVSVFVLLYEALVEFYVQYVGPMAKVFGFGMQVDYGIALLSILAAANSLAQIFSARIRTRVIAASASLAVWMYYWGNIAAEVPNRFLMLSALGMLSFLTAVLFRIPPTEVRIEIR